MSVIVARSGPQPQFSEVSTSYAVSLSISSRLNYLPQRSRDYSQRGSTKMYVAISWRALLFFHTWALVMLLYVKYSARLFSPTEVSCVFTGFAATGYLKGHSIDSRHLESKSNPSIFYFALNAGKSRKWAEFLCCHCVCLIFVDSNINCRGKKKMSQFFKLWFDWEITNFSHFFSGHREQMGTARALAGLWSSSG